MGIFKKQNIKITEENSSKTPLRFKKRKSRTEKLESRPKKKRLKRIIIFSVIFMIIVTLGFFGYQAYNAYRKMFDNDGGILNLLGGTQTQALKGESSGRTNILILGIGDKGHDGENLSDTIMIASIDAKTKNVAFISIPRDLYVQIPNYGYGKINTAHAYGEMNKVQGGGPALAKQTIEKVTGLTLHYYIRADFSGLKEAVDALGGVSVDVENSFCDYDYPVEYKGDSTKVCFDKGKQNMNGTRALQYSRSRHALGVEGSDFARSKRQQKVLVAIKEKAFTNETLFNPKKMIDLMGTLSEHIKTDFQVNELSRLYEIAKQVDQSKIINRTFDTSAEGLLVSDSNEAGSVLKPRTGNFKEIQAVIKNIFAIIAVRNEKANIVVLNGTWNYGLASRLADSLTKEGYNIQSNGDADTKNYTKTKIIDYTDGKKPETIKALETKFGVTATKEKVESPSSDIKIIIGKDYKESY